MQYELTRNWEAVVQPASGEGYETRSLDAGTLIGSVEILPGIPMTDVQFADGLRNGMLRAVDESPPEPKPKRGRPKKVIADE